MEAQSDDRAPAGSGRLISVIVGCGVAVVAPGVRVRKEVVLHHVEHDEGDERPCARGSGAGQLFGPGNQM